MRIEFKKIEIHNFMSFSDETFDFSENKGMNLICGKNNDIPGHSSTNGCGKCLDPTTNINIEFSDDIIYNDFLEFLKNTNSIKKI